MLSLLTLTAACGVGEDIRVRDRDSLLFSGRANYVETVSKSPTRNIGIGGELGAYGNRGEYTSPTGKKDYHVTMTYAAFLAEIGFRNFLIRPKIGIGMVDFSVAGQTTTVGEAGLGLMVGVEGRYRVAEPVDVFVRGTGFQRSSLHSSLLEFGFGFYPERHVAVELGYGIASNVIDDGLDFFNAGNSADVEAQGLLVSMTLSF